MHGSTGTGVRTLSRFQLSRKKIIFRIISKVKYYFRLYSPKNWELWAICQLATCNDRRPRTRLDLTSYIIIAHSVKRRQLVELFNAEIVELEIGGIHIYRPFGEFHRAKSYCHLYGTQGQR
ncbi:hypothetical protein TNCV_1779041 [Trichonephila clavipes]|nr:hypothetical protein TNCV_1779041 [Trichonephila clavipes]